jgi:hypothetical protein
MFTAAIKRTMSMPGSRGAIDRGSSDVAYVCILPFNVGLKGRFSELRSAKSQER